MDQLESLKNRIADNVFNILERDNVRISTRQDIGRCIERSLSDFKAISEKQKTEKKVTKKKTVKKSIIPEPLKKIVKKS